MCDVDLEIVSDTLTQPSCARNHLACGYNTGRAGSVGDHATVTTIIGNKKAEAID